MRTCLTTFCAALLLLTSAHAAVIAPPALRDNTIFESPSGNSNALGETFFVGASGGAAATRRGLLAFDMSGLPSGAQIDRVTLRLTLADAAAQETAPRSVSLHRLLSDWGEGTSNAGNTGGSGNGTAATTGDATWLMQFYNSDPWTTPGGDFLATGSASTPVGVLADVGTVYQWETLRGGSPTGMVLDVEAWLANSSTNFGWLIKVDDESILRTVRRFYSSDSLNAALRPELEIEYSLTAAAVPEPAALFVALVVAACATPWFGRRRRHA